MSLVLCLQSVVLSHFGPSDRPHSSNTLLLQNMGMAPQEHMAFHTMTSNHLNAL
jgi:hypothetical protein